MVSQTPVCVVATVGALIRDPGSDGIAGVRTLGNLELHD
jgi:hypothetical protein